jgi:hypothetical protein
MPDLPAQRAPTGGMRGNDRDAESGHAWAREALAPNAILLYVAAGGFEADVVKQAQRTGPAVVAWSLEDLYPNS